MGILKTIKDNSKNNKDKKTIKDYKEKVKEIFTIGCTPYSRNNKPEEEIQTMRKYLEDEVEKINDCLNFMENKMKKNEKNSNTFNNLSVLKKLIGEATKSEGLQLNKLSKIGDTICKKVLNNSGDPSGKKLALNSNLRIFDKQAKKWSISLASWIKNYMNKLNQQEQQAKQALQALQEQRIQQGIQGIQKLKEQYNL